VAKTITAVTTPDQHQTFLTDQLKVSGDSVTLLRELTQDIVGLEVNVGRAMFEMGKKLSTVRATLKEKGVDGAWEKWCQFFEFSKDYANRMIQVSEVFKDADAVPTNLTFRHFRELARFNVKTATEQDVAKLARLISAAGLNTHDTRHLISASNAGKIDMDLDQLSERSPKLRKELDEKLKAAKEMGVTQATARLDELQTRVTAAEAQTKEMEAQVTEKASAIVNLEKQVKTQIAAAKIGEGDLELGKVKIELEQAKQAKETAEMQLKEVASDASKARQTLERFMHSPAGQAKADVKKAFEDLNKFFKDSMTPAYLALRVQRANSPETQAAIKEIVNGIRGWCDQADALLNGPVVIEPEVLPAEA
jgi:hypothetical protein